MNTREQFEKYMSNDGAWPKAIERIGDGYKLMAAHTNWTVWKAATEAAAQYCESHVVDVGGGKRAMRYEPRKYYDEIQGRHYGMDYADALRMAEAA